MKIVYKSNIDAYKGLFTNHDTTQIGLPQVGMMRTVTDGCEKLITDKGLFPMLEIHRVTIHDTWIEVDLWYSKNQAAVLKLRETNPFP